MARLNLIDRRAMEEQATAGWPVVCGGQLNVGQQRDCGRRNRLANCLLARLKMAKLTQDKCKGRTRSWSWRPRG